MTTEEMLAQIIAKLEEMNALLRSCTEQPMPSSPPSTSIHPADTEEREAAMISSVLTPPTSAPPQDADPGFQSGVSEVSTEGELCILFDADADGGGVDHLSRLPDSLLRDIVSRLPIKDAARTAVLSRRWSSIWRAAPLLIYNADARNAVLGTNPTTSNLVTVASASPAPSPTSTPSQGVALDFQFGVTKLLIASPTRCSTLRLYRYACVPMTLDTPTQYIIHSHTVMVARYCCLFGFHIQSFRSLPWPPWVFARVFRTWVLLVSPLSLLRPPDTSNSSCRSCMDSSNTLTFDPGITLFSTSIVMSIRLPGSSIDTLNWLSALLLKVASSLSEKEKGHYPRKKELMSMLELDKFMTEYLEGQLLCTLLKIPGPPPNYKMMLLLLCVNCLLSQSVSKLMAEMLRPMWIFSWRHITHCILLAEIAELLLPCGFLSAAVSKGPEIFSYHTTHFVCFSNYMEWHVPWPTLTQLLFMADPTQSQRAPWPPPFKDHGKGMKYELLAVFLSYFGCSQSVLNLMSLRPPSQSKLIPFQLYACVFGCAVSKCIVRLPQCDISLDYMEHWFELFVGEIQVDLCNIRETVTWSESNHNCLAYDIYKLIIWVLSMQCRENGVLLQNLKISWPPHALSQTLDMFLTTTSMYGILLLTSHQRSSRILMLQSNADYICSQRELNLLAENLSCVQIGIIVFVAGDKCRSCGKELRPRPLPSFKFSQYVEACMAKCFNQEDNWACMIYILEPPTISCCVELFLFCTCWYLHNLQATVIDLDNFCVQATIQIKCCHLSECAQLGFQLHVQVATSQISTDYWHGLPLTKDGVYMVSFYIREHVPWDPGGLLQQRLGDKP